MRETASVRRQQPRNVASILDSARGLAIRDAHPHRHIAASNEGLIVGRPVRNAVLRLIRGMDLRLHPCSVDPAENHEKCGPNRPTAESSCNNAPLSTRVVGVGVTSQDALAVPDRR